MRKSVALLSAMAVFAAGCRQQPDAPKPQREDAAAKRLLQGIWINDGEESVAFRAKGDTIFYPDSTSLPVYFQVVGDTLVLHGASVAKYHILKQAAHLFVFENQSGDQVRLIKSDDPADEAFFSVKTPVVLNQRQLIKRDTVATVGEERYHCYMQVNPTTFKVVKTSYNDDGVAVDNVYYDNIVHLSVFKGASRIFSSDFHKADFASLIPDQYLRQSVLSDIVYHSAASGGLSFVASLAIPDSQSSYQIEIIVSSTGKIKMQAFD